MTARWRRWRERIRALVLPCPEPASPLISLQITGRHRITALPSAEPAPLDFWQHDALLRAKYPRLFWSHDRYWADQWREWYREQFRLDRERVEHRAECGLPPLQMPTLPMTAIAA